MYLRRKFVKDIFLVTVIFELSGAFLSFLVFVQDYPPLRAAGISLTIVSNNTAKRVRPFAERIGLDWVPLACKPLTIGLMVARHRLGVKKSQMAMVGDQIFADRMAAGLYGCPCLYLLPRTPRDRNKFVRLKRKYEPYWLDRYYKKGGTVHE